MAEDQKRFEAAYSRGEKPWDSGVVSVELRSALDAGLLPGRTAFEFGCGTGTNAIALAKHGFAVTAADFVASAVETARENARAAGVEIDFRTGDITQMDLPGPYDVLFDRGVYHHIRTVNLAGFLEMLERATLPNARWLSLAGNAKEQSAYGPPRVHEHELRKELEPLFEILDLHEFRFGTDRDEFRPLAWSILMRRRPY